MTETRASQIRVGIFVFVVLLAFTASVLFLGSQTRYFEQQYTLHASFDNIGGLLEGAAVQLAGVQVGRVSNIRFSPTIEDQKVWVKLNISQKVQERIREDSMATIVTAGLLGDKLVDITLGSQDQPVLKNEDIIRSSVTPGYTEIMERSTQLLDNAINITTSLDQMVSTFRNSETRLTVRETIRSVGNIVLAIEQGDGLLHSLIYKPDQGQILTNLSETAAILRKLVTEVQQGNGFLHSLLYDPEPKALAQMTTVLTTLQRLLQEVEKGDGALHTLIYEREGGKAIKALSHAAKTLETLLQEVKTGKGVLPSLLFDPQYQTVITDLQQAARNLRAITHQVTEGQGTLGALIQDPTVYENLAALLSGAQRSWILRSIIQSTTEKGKDNTR